MPVAAATRLPSESKVTGKLEARHLAAEVPKSMAEVEQLHRKSHWKKYLVINGVGAISTFVVLMVFILTKFLHGAWIVVILIRFWLCCFREFTGTTWKWRNSSPPKDWPACGPFATK